jgi:5'-phosphate synthase pdxT subunit
MVNRISIGIIGAQGAISEHVFSIKKTFKKLNILGEVIVVKTPNQIDKINALIIPGGESTAISNILYLSGLYDAILKRINENNLPIMGTCAGCVLLATELIDNLKEVKLLSVMDMKVKRNAFGRQKESFECEIEIKDFSKPYNAVFIRAPIIEDVWGNCRILAKVDDKIIMAKQGNFLALSFHPELTNDIRIHKYFLEML